MLETTKRGHVLRWCSQATTATHGAQSADTVGSTRRGTKESLLGQRSPQRSDKDGQVRRFPSSTVDQHSSECCEPEAAQSVEPAASRIGG